MRASRLISDGPNARQGWDMVRLVTDYGRESSLRENLYPLFEEVFGMPVDLLQDFHRRGYWDPSYCPYTYFDGDRALANVSRFSLPLIIKRQPILAAGIQSVMTLPDFRHLGLMTSLMEYMLEDIDHRYRVSLLFTGQPNLYQRFGFHKVPETISCYFAVPSFGHAIGTTTA